MKGYDSKCAELARYFLGDKATDERVAEVAQVIQDAIEAELKPDETMV